MMAVSLGVLSFKSGGLHIAASDSREYLTAAYHLVHHDTFSQAETADSTPPAMGREPAYSLFLAALMIIDPRLGAYTPACLKADDACSQTLYLSAGLANLAFIEIAGALIFAVAWRIGRNSWCALIAAGYLLFNFQMNKGWADPMSDRLAVLLVCVAMLATVWAWQGQRAWRWSVVGGVLAALTLTKAIFLTYFACVAMGVPIALLCSSHYRRRLMAAFAAGAVVYGAMVGGWALRNWQVAGNFALTDSRSAAVLGTRVVFDDMTPTQYFASFVYWTRGFGEGLARRLFPPEIVAPFDLYRLGTFDRLGQIDMQSRFDAAMQDNGASSVAALVSVERYYETFILSHPFVHIATTLPLIYRGLWIDEFAVVGFPVFCWMVYRSVRRRDTLSVLLLSVGAFNLLFYAGLSPNVPRYQMTAVPSIAFAVAMAGPGAARVKNWARRRSLGMGSQKSAS